MSDELRVAATRSAPELCLRPWDERDLPELIEAHRDPVLRRHLRWIVDDDDDDDGAGAGDGARWLAEQRRGRADGIRHGFAVLEGGAEGGCWAAPSSSGPIPRRATPRSATGRRPGRAAGAWRRAGWRR
ncbi:hypothetical protein NKH77_21180 [Streptomyces sp. M19]